MTPLPSAAPQPDDIYIGMSVTHPKFGTGVVDDVDGQKLEITFERGGQKKILASFLTHVREVPKAANDNLAPPSMHLSPFTPEAAGGLIATVARWVTETAVIPVPELSLCSSVALIAGLFGGKALGPTNSGINLYLTTLLQTAGGKGHPPKAIRAIAGSLGDAGTRAVTNGDHTSYAAIERTLRASPSTCIVMDEFGLTLQDINAKHNNSVAASIRKFLLAVYDQANSEFDGRIYASAETKKEASPIIGPALTVLGMTTVDTLYAGLSENSVADGFLNRFLFIGAAPHEGDILPPGLGRDVSVPSRIKEALKDGLTSFPKVLGLKPTKHVVPFVGGESGEAYRRWGEVFVWQHDKSWGEEARNIIGRAAENTVRLATIRAISRNPASPEVSVEDVEWGWAIVYHSISLIRAGVSRHLSSSPAEALRKSIIDAVRTHSGPLHYSKLLERKGVRGSDMRQLGDALAWLKDTDQLVDLSANQKPGKGSRFSLGAENGVRT